MTINQAQALKELHTIRDFVRFSMSRFYEHELYFGHGTDNPWDEAVQLVLGALHLPWNSNPQLLDSRLTTEEKSRVLDFLEQRVIKRRPLPYIIGESWYAGMPFYVDERVLIPRSPIQELIEQHFNPWLREGPVERILDLCTGSGCIGIVCAYAFEEAEVDLADISADALEVARRNITRHELDERVTAIESDLFSNLTGQRYDLIVSNPPYVDRADLVGMPQEYQHEPDLALGSGPDGLDITKQILRQADQFLAEDGLLVIEVGNSEVHLQQQYPHIPFTWLELEAGGNGVFLLTAAEVKQYCSSV
ncbi:MAG: 50S ribosomal protein L3 N(5)-glutamine methyltransferase [Amphritea sp.]|nr:50S ribosomal protein L3 N(5)-glutamine methyltransferase [Amphritea sp.]